MKSKSLPSKEETLNGLMSFVQDSPTPFHATANLVRMFQTKGFQPLYETDPWKLELGKSYYVTRNDSAIVAFRCGTQAPAESGIRMAGAHTDSPCLKLKPLPELKFGPYQQWGVEIYGSVLLSTWFDRQLSLAGRVFYRTKDGRRRSTLIDFKRALASIPNLAIHLNRDANEGRKINKQGELSPLVAQVAAGRDNLSLNLLLAEEIQKTTGETAETVLDWELSFYDVHTPSRWGWKGEFFSSARLDNLISCYIGALGLIESGPGQNAVFIGNDHEEVGSASTTGAQGSFLKDVISRWIPNHEDFVRAAQNSLFLSTDNAHGVHPNYADRHDGQHAPLLNLGPALKINANQRYATNSETGAYLIDLAMRNEIPLQKFVSRNDMPCGSTIGPITATELGIKTADLGVPTFAMHSIRETGGTDDPHHLLRLLLAFYTS